MVIKVPNVQIDQKNLYFSSKKKMKIFIRHSGKSEQMDYSLFDKRLQSAPPDYFHQLAKNSSFKIEKEESDQSYSFGEQVSSFEDWECEFKEIFTPNIGKKMSELAQRALNAFANSGKGTLFCGISDNGIVGGIEGDWESEALKKTEEALNNGRPSYPVTLKKIPVCFRLDLLLKNEEDQPIAITSTTANYERTLKRIREFFQTRNQECPQFSWIRQNSILFSN